MSWKPHRARQDRTKGDRPTDGTRREPKPLVLLPGDSQAEPVPPTCPYCKSATVLATGLDIYPHRDDLWDKNFYRCTPCGAYVGCHPGTRNALGTPANFMLRRLRNAAHQAFDPLWRMHGISRTTAYHWLAEQLGIPATSCHVAWFDAPQCERVVQVMTRLADDPIAFNALRKRKQ